MISYIFCIDIYLMQNENESLKISICYMYLEEDGVLCTRMKTSYVL